jgi:hypothetical protein
MFSLRQLSRWNKNELHVSRTTSKHYECLKPLHAGMRIKMPRMMDIVEI